MGESFFLPSLIVAFLVVFDLEHDDIEVLFEQILGSCTPVVIYELFQHFGIYSIDCSHKSNDKRREFSVLHCELIVS
jgi:hypothetical protein